MGHWKRHVRWWTLACVSLGSRAWRAVLGGFGVVSGLQGQQHWAILVMCDTVRVQTSHSSGVGAGHPGI